MPLPLIFIGLAAVSGASGFGAAVKAGVDHQTMKKIYSNTEQRINEATERLEDLRRQCGDALENLGREKIYILSGNMKEFLEGFSKIKNVDFTGSQGLMELKNFKVDTQSMAKIEQIEKFARNLAGGAVVGLTGGALTAFGAYNAAMTLATASTGTAIGSLSGAAATNATLAFFGGGSLATGGLGVAGGTAVLGGLVAGPALLAMGIIAGAKAGKAKENAIADAAEADVVCEQLENGARQCIAIRRRAYVLHNLLARIDTYFLPLIYAMEGIIEQEGTDFSQYAPDSRSLIVAAVSTALSIKAVMDTPILTENGSLTSESDKMAEKIKSDIEEKEKFMMEHRYAG